ncbi:DUF6221 family protein [Streptomyces tagetis]|uniref:Uncharacterized protein n=1 Tax=Streptomyces tagetis TaxID=2820809 RepID=A0A940XN82_9ACTN|nr:DUF6221 family protein [Streptomyces sp. RG38]MBQ0827684.1 hypothetical protein [Streptomyces sp. RG38]
MDELVQWLGAQLDADEQVARAADAELSAVFTRIGSFDPEMAADERHIMMHRPARVLREIDAKRQLVKLHGRAVLRAGGGAQHFDTETVCRSCEPNLQFPELSWPCTTLRLLALPYADRSGYREEWRP